MQHSAVWAGLEFVVGLNRGRQGMDTLPDLGYSRNTTDLLTPRPDLSVYKLPSARICVLLPPHDDDTRCGAGMGWFKEGGIPHPAHNTDPQDKQRREGLTEPP